MEAVAHNKKFATQVGIPQRVGREFAAADAAKGGAKRPVGTKIPNGYGR